jgi:hypothetical protein
LESENGILATGSFLLKQVLVQVALSSRSRSFLAAQENKCLVEIGKKMFLLNSSFLKL